MALGFHLYPSIVLAVARLTTDAAIPLKVVACGYL